MHFLKAHTMQAAVGMAERRGTAGMATEEAATDTDNDWIVNRGERPVAVAST